MPAYRARIQLVGIWGAGGHDTYGWEGAKGRYLGKGWKLTGLESGWRTEINQDPNKQQHPSLLSILPKAGQSFASRWIWVLLLFPCCFPRVPWPPLLHCIPPLLHCIPPPQPEACFVWCNPERVPTKPGVPAVHRSDGPPTPFECLGPAWPTGTKHS